MVRHGWICEGAPGKRRPGIQSAEMKLHPRYFPLITLLAGVAALVGLAIYTRSGSDAALFVGVPAISILLGVVLAIVQLISGFAIAPQCFRISTARGENPFLYWSGLLCSTIPFVAIGLLALFVR